MRLYPKVCIVLPAFNEQDNLKVVTDQLIAVIADYDYKIIIVDDGSHDKTADILKQLHQENPRIHFLSFSRNFGHQNALKAGIDYADGDCMIAMDCDLQHPVTVVARMIELWQQGYDVVYTQRQDDVKSVSFFKRTTSALFYEIINKLSDVSVAHGRADFFLVDRKVLHVLKSYDESPLFFRGFIPWIGFKQIGITYAPAVRFSGQSKYSLKKMFALAIAGIAFSGIKLLRLPFFVGAFFVGGALIAFGMMVVGYFWGHHGVSASAIIVTTLFFLGGIQTILLGVIGVYLGGLFINAKKRPHYIVRTCSDIKK